MERKSFYDQIESNKRNSWILMFFVFAALAVMTLVFSVIIARFYGAGLMFLFLMFMSVFNIGYILYTYYNSDKIALKSVSAYPAEGTRYQQLVNIVEEMAIAGGLPKPRTYVMPSKDINAFATGRDPQHSVVCITEGAIEKLNRAELQAVIAHELTHIRNYDIRFVTFIAVMVGLVAIMSQMFLRSLWFGSISGGRRRGGGRSGGGGGAFLVLLVVGVILSIIAPIIVKMIQFAISRKREYMADAGAVELTRYPQGLVDALKKIQSDYAQPVKHTDVNSAVAPMFLADPSKSRLAQLFQTHPPIKDRIAALQAM
jgi:heat shock protein HtpX